MAEGLRKLVGAESGRLLQEKLESWYRDYETNSCDQNLNRCCEIIQLNSEIQGQLFTILNETSREGGHYAGVETIKTRPLPWLGTCFSCATSGRLFETNLSLTQDSIEKDRQLRELASNQAFQLQKLQEELTSTHLQLDHIEEDLAKTQLALEDTKTKSATTLLAAEDEIVQLKAALKTSHAQEKDALRKLARLNDYERQIQILRDEISILDAQKSVLQSRLARSRSPSPRHRVSRSPGSFPLRSCSPGQARRKNASRRACLVARFGDIYAQERLDAETLLRTYISDVEMVQRIIYIAAVESFRAAKMAYRQFKIRVRETLSLGHSGPESLEDTVLDYIVRHEDLYDVQASVNEVIRSMNISPKISLPPEIDFIVISSLIRELCRVAFSMQTLVPPLDIAFGTDGELFSETKYRHSFGSDFTAALVAYHVWPALMENDVVIVKGEAVTKRGALWSRRSRSRSRSTSPLLSHHVSQSHSPSPVRSGSPSKWAY
ncbi:mitochondria-eating protein isoform X1 [Falco biarmicus]|uniref:mitochondria-eating protein isoform X2 n=1 Tax=Falco rusticolus TaxID=120794 RepID=UPI0018869CA7|nr:mitochondria-eating protein isoform X2 [Falco rusticolus]XP_055556955.1 mitochondria-eating protein isoform X2 [Falco cherrug]XP_055654069.1 mitochondria-eating protein isoform X3 [Falco peregrinus]XP_056189258.1 mitochondria-eating protein isoform X1 [Falco biarmicus]